MPKPPTLDDLRRYAVARTLFKPTTLLRAIEKLGFVQADPIRAPARAQDLTLRHRVKDYHAGDLERRYAKLPVEEDCLVNYGFLPRKHLALMHPRIAARKWSPTTKKKAAEVLEFIRAHGPTHPRLVDAEFAHGRTVNAWGGSSNATTHLLDGMHYRGLLRVARREAGTRIYEAVEHPPAEIGREARLARATALLELVLRKYAPLPGTSFRYLTYLLLGYGAPHLAKEARAALVAAKAQLATVRIDRTDWYWPADENPRSSRYAPDERVRLLAPFDPIAWDRRRFELLWGWTYRFEAYTPEAKRKLGYYALPLLWRDRMVGWGNASAKSGRLLLQTHFADATVRDAAFKAELAEEKARMKEFLGL
ncbi:MAG: winged helix DNA-binding domain-containing protein [Burkholderiales bacterium]|nr:winged helix DNA-binding domain-containing protein [Burkholderiales bacterium]